MPDTFGPENKSNAAADKNGAAKTGRGISADGKNTAAPADDVLLSVRHLQKRYGDLTVLRDISVDIRKGEKIAVIGPSGSGKSTFLRCLNCMEDPDGGTIMFDGEDLADMRVDINRHR